MATATKRRVLTFFLAPIRIAKQHAPDEGEERGLARLVRAEDDRQPVSEVLDPEVVQ